MTQVLKIAKFAIYIRLPPSEITKKTNKNDSLNRDFLKVLNRYGI